MSPLSLPLWLTASGPHEDVALSTRCRLARNLVGWPFPWRAFEGQRKEVADVVRDAASRSGGEMARARALSAEDLSDEAMARLLEWRYASRDWAHGGPHRWLLAAPDGATSLLINEEDHLRLQTILPGLQVELAYKVASRELDEMAARLEMAHDERIGWLTASPVNAGSGLRVSVLLHMAGLAVSDTREAVLEAAAGVGCAVRGLYGEGTPGTGELFQVSNTYAGGSDAGRIVERVASAARYLVEAERRARRERFDSPRGHAQIKAAAEDALHCLFHEEAAPRRLLPLISILRLAVAEGVLPGSLSQTAAWVALAGVEAVARGETHPAKERYEAVRRSAALRQRLRAFMDGIGTFPA